MTPLSPDVPFLTGGWGSLLLWGGQHLRGPSKELGPLLRVFVCLSYLLGWKRGGARWPRKENRDPMSGFSSGLGVDFSLLLFESLGIPHLDPKCHHNLLSGQEVWGIETDRKKAKMIEL